MKCSPKKGLVVSLLTVFVSYKNALFSLENSTKPDTGANEHLGSDQAKLRPGDVFPVPVPGQRNVVSHRFVVVAAAAFGIEGGQLHLDGLGHIGGHTEPATGDHGNSSAQLRAKEKDELGGERTHDGIEAGNSVESVGGRVNQVNQVEGHAGNSGAKHEHCRPAVRGVCRTNALKGGPHPNADSDQNTEFKAVADLVQHRVHDSLLWVRGSSVGRDGDTASVDKMGNAQDNLLSPALRRGRENDIANFLVN